MKVTIENTEQELKPQFLVGELLENKSIKNAVVMFVEDTDREYFTAIVMTEIGTFDTYGKLGEYRKEGFKPFKGKLILEQ